MTDILSLRLLVDEHDREWERAMRAQRRFRFLQSPARRVVRERAAADAQKALSEAERLYLEASDALRAGH